MRLLHTKKLVFEEFYETELPKYAILSHRWRGKEVSFQELDEKRVTEKSRMAKINNCRFLAAQRGFDWVWIDSCCIDRRSSAELSEAINSMFRWYQNSRECYAYLWDIGTGETENFTKSEWFERGWTLQELLAPKDVLFLDSNWTEFGTKFELASQIYAATDIDKFYLRTQVREPGTFLSRSSVAQRMSWASKRKTSRPEDLAYCLLGLFDVNMPLLYGEGLHKAFLRLQMEIISSIDDETIFAWTPPPDGQPHSSMGMLAAEPRCFSDSGKVVTMSLYKTCLEAPTLMTRKGLQLRLKYAYGARINVGSDLLHRSEFSSDTEVEVIDLPLLCGGQSCLANDPYLPAAQNVTLILLRQDDPNCFWRTFGVGADDFRNGNGRIGEEDPLFRTIKDRVIHVPQTEYATERATLENRQDIVKALQKKAKGLR